MRWIDGGLLGQWAVWTRARGGAARTRSNARARPATSSRRCSRYGAALTDANGADIRRGAPFRRLHPGNSRSIAPRRACSTASGASIPDETLSPGQAEEITRVSAQLSGAHGRRAALIVSSLTKYRAVHALPAGCSNLVRQSPAAVRLVSNTGVSRADLALLARARRTRRATPPRCRIACGRRRVRRQRAASRSCARAAAARETDRRSSSPTRFRR